MQEQFFGLTALFLSAIVLSACDLNEGPAEEAGDEIDQAMDKVEEAKGKMQN
ncbi:MAG: hypothetical protein OQL28_13700 [Sedimenticola sp.]|nr:hypothetical protein [Sedimenticola sp.]